MTENNTYSDFDALTVELQGSNLIEASAGTGKTYSIALLVLRLVLEKKFSIKDILMVTFTKAAVAELEHRIRVFIRSAYKASLGKTIKDANISSLVELCMRNTGATGVRQRMRDTVLLLDETSVLTIHSFCQQTLTEFAFETNQLFGAEMLPDLSAVTENEFNKFWRKHVTTLPAALLQKLWKEGMRKSVLEILKSHLGGKKYEGFDETKDYYISHEEQQQCLTELGAVTKKVEMMRAGLLQYVIDNNAQITKSSSNAYAKNNALPLLQTPQKFLDFIWSKNDKVNIIKAYGDLLEKLGECEKIADEANVIIQVIVHKLYCLAIKEVSAGVRLYKERNNILGYDDLIGNLHNALTRGENIPLVQALRNKYRAVFVDEFQDTDRLQFDIFDRAFKSHSILFYIGDPKQSIYAWRKADIFTYFKARNGVDKLYSMNHNFRSAVNYIEAMNHFFLPSEGFDTFYFGTERDRIDYFNVHSPVSNTHGLLNKGGAPDIPISVFTLPKRGDICQAVAAQVACLLRDHVYSISKEAVEKDIIPADIGILVRTGPEASDIKQALASLGIPAITVDDSKVLQSAEAKYLLYLLAAMETPDRSSINRALLSPFTRFDISTILTLHDETTLQLFDRYRESWLRDGIYTAVMKFIVDFNVRDVLLDSAPENGERILTNLFQLTELLHQVQNRKNLSMPELISWLQRGTEGMATEGDQYIQRVESDEDAVKIVTIHKSKGLEYNIVLAPFLDFVDKPFEFASFREPLSGDYVNIERSRMDENQTATYLQQMEQENRRLLYVAVTRAVYKCFIYKNSYHHFNLSTLSTFLDELKKNAALSQLISFEANVSPEPETGLVTRPSEQGTAIQPSIRFALQEENWCKMSYSMLAAKYRQSSHPPAAEHDEPYDNFVFRVLQRGDKTGNMLHFLFENLSFSDNTKWVRRLEETAKRFVPGQYEVYFPMLLQMAHHVLETTVTVGEKTFSLSEVAKDKQIAEFEFDFPVQLFRPESIRDLSTDEEVLQIKRFSDYTTAELEGIMNGKIDLFFEHCGLYYILDWKSNFLGDSLSDYSRGALAEAMNGGNYHLQYLIYTLAAKKYLESRINSFVYEKQFGGVIYLFIRGMRHGSENGVFTVKPPLPKINSLEELFYKKTPAYAAV